jgi:hypothetical protein
MSGANPQPAPTATMLISGDAASVLPIGTGYYPQEGSRAVASQYNWSAQLAYTEDLSQLVARGMETTIQTVWIDNSECSQPVLMLIAGTGQKIECPGSAQGVFPVFFSGTPAFLIYTTGLIAACTRCIFLNIPVNPGSWVTSGGAFEAQSSDLNIVASQAVKATPGRIGKVVVNTAIATAAATINDCPTTGAAGAGNTILTIPIGTVAGTFYSLDWPCLSGITAIIGGTGALAISFT